jgi:probable rRNA maturation factor
MNDTQDGFQVEIDAVNRQSKTVDLRPLEEAALRILKDFGIRTGALSIAVVDDPTMHDLNRKHLNHDYPTDVLSFLFEHSGSRLEGEVIASLDYAVREAAKWGWAERDELLLYVVHGLLHLVGFDDQSEPDRQAMRRKELEYFSALGRPTPPGRDGDDFRSDTNCETAQGLGE